MLPVPPLLPLVLPSPPEPPDGFVALRVGPRSPVPRVGEFSSPISSSSSRFWRGRLVLPLAALLPAALQPLSLP